MGLLGYAPTLVRKRGWKRTVAQGAGWQGYALFSEESLTKLHLQLDDLKAAKFSDSPLKLFGLNLQARYEALLESRQIRVLPEMADVKLVVRVGCAPLGRLGVVERSRQAQSVVGILHPLDRPLTRPGGRTGPGAVNHCDHGAGAMVETILDWRPFDYYTAEMRITPGRFDVLQTTYLEALPDGRTGVKVCYQLKNPPVRWMARPVCGMVGGFLGLELRRLKRIITG